MCLALVAPMAVIAAQPAGAAQSASCKTLGTKVVGKKTVTTVSGCLPVAATSGAGTGAFTSAPKGAKKGSITLTITWAKGHGTSSAVIQFATAKTLGKCAKGGTAKAPYTRQTITGKITAGTGTAGKTIKKNETVTGSICNGKTLTVEKGTTIKF